MRYLVSVENQPVGVIQKEAGTIAKGDIVQLNGSDYQVDQVVHHSDKEGVSDEAFGSLPVAWSRMVTLQCSRL